MVPMTTTVLAKLTEIQRQRGETDEQFAGVLGVSRSHWTHIRNGRRHLTYPITKRAAQRFPEVYQLVVIDLSASSPRVAS